MLRLTVDLSISCQPFDRHEDKQDARRPGIERHYAKVRGLHTHLVILPVADLFDWSRSAGLSCASPRRCMS